MAPAITSRACTLATMPDRSGPSGVGPVDGRPDALSRLLDEMLALSQLLPGMTGAAR